MIFMADQKILNRINYLIGHLKANLKMLKDDRYCIDVIRQNQAVISALRKVNELILKNHLETCVTQAVKGKSEKEKRRVYQEILDIFKEQ